MVKSKRKSISTAYGLTKQNSQGRDVLRRLLKNKTAVLGLTIIVVLFLTAILSGFIYDYDTDIVSQNIAQRLQSPSIQHIFGTDDLGRDIFKRVVYGSRYSLSIALVCNFVSLLIGSILGALAAYYGKTADMLIMRVMDVFLAIPSMLLAIAIVAALGSSTQNLIIAMTISGIPASARVMRGAVLTIRDVEYIEAAKAIGAKDRFIIWSHVIPNCLAPIIVHTTLYMAVSITSIAGLSFLGLGIKAPMPEWGAMLSAGRNYIRGYSYMTLFPGLAIMLTALAFNLLGDGLRDAFDPRLK